MGKPEIIGYQTDPDRWWAVPYMPEVTMDSEGISVPEPSWDRCGRMHEEQRYLQPDEVDAFMLHHGMKRVYRERRYRATPTHDGYRLNGWKLYCKRCETATMSTEKLPHDLALAHRCAGS